MLYACITVLRALALLDGPKKIWNDYTKFESHLEERLKTEVYTKVSLLYSPNFLSFLYLTRKILTFDELNFYILSILGE